MSIPGLFVALAAVLQAAGSGRETWTEFAPEGAGFSVRMPSEPKETKVTAKSSVGISKVKQFVTTDAGCSFAVKYGQTTNPRDPAEANLARVKRSFLAANKNAGPGDAVPYEDHPGWETEYTTTGAKGSTFKVRFYVVGKSVIELVTIVPTAKAAAHAEDIAAFFDSFKLEDKEAAPEPTVAAAPVPPAEAMPKAEPAEDEWKVFQPAGGGFSVLMLGKVNQNRQSIPSPKGPASILSFTSGDLEQHYSVSRVDPPKGVATTSGKQGIDEFRDGFVKSIKGRVTSEKEIKQGDQAGREIDVQVPETIFPGGMTVRTRVFIVESRLYAAVATASNKTLPQHEGDVTRFLDSFQLTGNAGEVDIKAAEWAEFAPEDGSFTILLPGTPQLKTQPLPTPFGQQEIVTYTGTDLPLVFVVVHSPMPNGTPAGPQLKNFLDRARDGFLQGSNSKLIDDGDIAPNGVAGRQFRAKAASGGVIMGRILPVRGRLYQLLVEMPEGQPNTEKVGKFFDSFKLKDGNPEAGATKKAARPEGR